MMKTRIMWLVVSSLFLGSFIAYGLPNEVRYEIDAALDTGSNIITGAEKIFFTNRTGQELLTLYIHVYANAFRQGSESTYLKELEAKAGFFGASLIYANPLDDAFMEIKSVLADGQPLSFSMEDTLLAVDLPEVLPDGASTALEITFVYDLMETTANDLMAFSHAIRSAHREGVYTITLWYPKLAVFDGTGWNLEPYSLLGEFYGDFADYEVRLTVPPEFTVGATGVKLSEVTTEAGKTLLYSAKSVHDFAWAASADYEVSEIEWEGVKIISLTTHPLFADIGDLASEAIQFYSEEFGPYPYDTFTLAQVRTGGGMEYPGIVMIGQGTPREVVHEVAHQWWYSAVGNDEFDEAWLDEGFTTFAEELFLIESGRGSENSLRSSLNFSEPGEAVLQPTSAFGSASAYASAIYTKGSGILWMLRGYLGDETFSELLRGYYAQFKLQNVTTSDFTQYASSFAGEDLDWFFDQWLNTTKTLDYFVSDVRPGSTGESASAFTVTLQKSGEAVMPVDVEVTALAGGEPLTFRWDGASLRQEFVIDGITGIDAVFIDPARSVLEQNRVNNTWTADSASSSLALPWGLALAVFWIGLRLWKVGHLNKK